MKTLHLFIALLFGLSAFSQEFPAPRNFTTTIDSDSIYMTWQSPQMKSLSHYNIYFYGYTQDHPIKIASTTDTTFSWSLPDFRYTMNFMLSAEYENPNGVSDTIIENWTIPTLLDIPIEFDFEDNMHQLFTSNIMEGTDFWTLTDNTYYSSSHSVQFISTSENAKSQLISAPYSGYTVSNPVVKFMCKIPSNGDQSDTLRVGKMNNFSTQFMSEALTNINEWQQLEFDLGTGEYNLLFEATSGMGNGVFIDDVRIESSINVTSLSNDLPSLNIAPHPVIGTSTISLSQKDQKAELKIYSITGQIVLNKTLTNSLKISNSDFSPGIYLYEVTLTNGEKTLGKLVVQ